MIRSMTAYARKETQQSWGHAVWELRSVNQRYLETYIRLPEQFRSLEPVIRERLKQRLTRGKIECQLRFEVNSTTQTGLILNNALAKQIIESAQWIKELTGEGTINPLELLRWPGVMAAQEQDLDQITQQVLQLLEQTINEFIAGREREGEAIKTLLEQRLCVISGHVASVREKMPQLLQWQREKLLGKLEELKLQIDNNRLEQELVLLAQRIDVAEELDRLATHVKETELILRSAEPVGRRLDFMMQEFNRESNTLASKSISAEITAIAIDLKVLIEQMREQIQNIE